MDYAAGLLRAGQLVAFPTETVYGLGANSADPNAVSLVYAAKGRPAANPLIWHLAESSWLQRYAVADQRAQLIARRFWPGPLTLVLPARKGGTLALRVPAHPVARTLIAAVGRPLAAPSANRSGRLSPTNAVDTYEEMHGRVRLILDGGPCPVGVESTVLDLSKEQPLVLRPGGLTVEALRAAIGEVEIFTGPASAEGPLPSPGMAYRHYAPTHAVHLVYGEPGPDVHAQVRFLLKEWPSAGVLCATENALSYPRERSLVVAPYADGALWAERLFAMLRTADRRFDRLIVEMPHAAGLGLAVRDRLRRAAQEHDGAGGVGV